MADHRDVLEQARLDVGMTVRDLWFRYFALGGLSTPLEIDALLHGAIVGSVADRDRMAVALNERYAELGGDHPVPYAGDR